jgi:hypothetical protein
MQALAFNSRVVHCPTVPTKIKRRLKEAVRPIITRGVAAEESRRVRRSCSAWRTPAWTARKGSHLVRCCSTHPLFILLLVLAGFVEWVLAHDGSHADWTNVVFPTSEMFCVPFAELLGFPHGRIPDAESISRCCGREDCAA